MVECESITRSTLFNRRFCFNRYMVECESIKNMTKGVLTTVLIDTWWNVNQSFGEEQLKEAFVLIDTWWNVNTVLINLNMS